jgi:hypothetical protein
MGFCFCSLFVYGWFVLNSQLELAKFDLVSS